jgi:thymidylate synthase (FAD)
MVQLISHYGNDDNAVDVARVSYSKLASEYTAEQNARLIHYLVEHGHTSPFRHQTLQFRVSCPIYVERQLFKHQVGVSVNSISGRYVDFSDSYTRITRWRKQSKNSKQGSEGFIDNQELATALQDHVIDKAKAAYIGLIALGVSKEQARSILPLALNTEFIWTGSFLAFVHMCHLRLKPDAQQETREVVEEMLEQVRLTNDFTESLKAFKL